MNCAPKDCYELNERIAIKMESQVQGNIITQSIREHCAKCERRGRKTASQIQGEIE